MEEIEFIRLEYAALRAEILATQQRNFRTIGAGALALPAINWLLDRHDIQAAALALPFLVIVVVLLYLADNYGVMRCGRYIRRCIEPRVRGSIGWENWLENAATADRRGTERYMRAAVGLLFAMYYVAATWLAWLYAFSKFDVLIAVTIHLVNTTAGALVTMHVLSQLAINSRDLSEQPSVRDAEDFTTNTSMDASPAADARLSVRELADVKSAAMNVLDPNK